MKYKPVLLPTVRAMLEARRGSWPQICRDLDLSYSTLQKIAQGQSENPGVNTIERLHKHLTESAAA